MIIMLLIGWIIDTIQNRKWDKEREAIRATYPVKRESSSGYHINPKLWEKAKGVNSFGKYNDIW